MSLSCACLPFSVKSLAFVPAPSPFAVALARSRAHGERNGDRHKRRQRKEGGHGGHKRRPSDARRRCRGAMEGLPARSRGRDLEAIWLRIRGQFAGRRSRRNGAYSWRADWRDHCRRAERWTERGTGTKARMGCEWKSAKHWRQGVRLQVSGDNGRDIF